jgi:hypothetical protein
MYFNLLEQSWIILEQKTQLARLEWQCAEMDKEI